MNIKKNVLKLSADFDNQIPVQIFKPHEFSQLPVNENIELDILTLTEGLSLLIRTYEKEINGNGGEILKQIVDRLEQNFIDTDYESAYKAFKETLSQKPALKETPLSEKTDLSSFQEDDLAGTKSTKSENSQINEDDLAWVYFGTVDNKGYQYLNVYEGSYKESYAKMAKENSELLDTFKCILTYQIKKNSMKKLQF